MHKNPSHEQLLQLRASIDNYRVDRGDRLPTRSDPRIATTLNTRSEPAGNSLAFLLRTVSPKAHFIQRSY